jgi:hypothetical protein
MNNANVKRMRYVIVGTNKDGELGSWNDMDSETWRAPWGIYDTEFEEFVSTGYRWKWLARFAAKMW